MSEKLTPTSQKPRTSTAVTLSTAAVLVVVISFVASKKFGLKGQTSPENPSVVENTLQTEAQNQAQDQAQSQGQATADRKTAPKGTLPAQGQAQAQASAQTSEAVTPVAAVPPASCWEGKFSLKAARLTAVQKESLGERAQKIHLNEMFERLSVRKINEAQLCVRAGSHALPFEKDSKDPSVIMVRGGTGRIHEKSSLQVSYCLKAEDCSPCKIKKDSFEDALLGESEADAQANSDEDVTSKLSPEVRRELARLENESKPVAVDAWELQGANTRCGRS